jgi:hypothetical protein
MSAKSRGQGEFRDEQGIWAPSCGRRRQCPVTRHISRIGWLQTIRSNWGKPTIGWMGRQTRGIR